MVRVYSLSVQICLEILCLGLGGDGNCLLLQVKIILSSWFVCAFHTLGVCLTAIFGVREELLPYLGAVVPRVLCCASTLRADLLRRQPRLHPKASSPVPASISVVAHTGNLWGLCCFSCFLPQSEGEGCCYRLSMHCPCRVAGECDQPGVTGGARQLSLSLTEMLEAK